MNFFKFDVGSAVGPKVLKYRLINNETQAVFEESVEFDIKPLPLNIMGY